MERTHQEIKQSFGALLRKLREEAGGLDERGRPVLTQALLARAAGLKPNGKPYTPNDIGRWETGESLPSADAFLRLTVVLGAPCGEWAQVIEAPASEVVVPAASGPAPTGAGLDDLGGAPAKKKRQAPRRARRAAS